jgi:hypothetical protein
MNKQKLLKGDLLIATNRGFIKLSEINKEDLIVVVDNDKYYYDNIDEIEKVYKKKYKLNKISFINIFESYLVNDNIQIRSIQNLPLSLETPDIPNYLTENYNRCLINSEVSSLSSFDFIGFPLNLNLNNNEILNENSDKYKYLGILFYLKIINKTIEDFKESHKEIYEFINNYLDKTIDINLITLDNIFLLNKENLLALADGLISINNDINIKINDINYYQIIKFVFLLCGSICNSYYKDGIITIKINKINKNFNSNKYFISNNYIWNKIRNIKKIDFNGNLYNLKLKSEKPYLTEIGIIS